MKKKIFIALLLILCLSATLVFSGCESVIKAIFGSGQNPENPSNPDDPNGGDKPQEHVHEMTLISSDQSVCTGDGSVTYWQCKTCKKYFADEKGEQEITDISLISAGHLPTVVGEADGHCQKCKYCGKTIVEKQPHASDAWVRSKTEHHKVCDVCGVTFQSGAHQITDNECSVCHYFTNYAERCSSSYGYDFFGTLQNGAKYQSFYNKLDSVLSAFHDNADADAARKSTDSGYRYVCSGVNYVSANLTQNEALSVWATYRNDHPLYYWMLGNVMYTSSEIITCVDYNYANGSDRVAKNAQLYDEITKYLNAVSGETSDYRIALALHDEIINNIDYARDESGAVVDASWAHTVLGALDRKQAVCDGYSRTFQMLLSACSVNSAMVTGVATQDNGGSEGHAWNIAQIDGDWYWFDLTWDDQPHFAGGIIYDYFCKSGSALKGHKTNTTNDFDTAINYLYGLPAPASSNYNTDKTELGETFTANGFTYQVSGFNKVTLLKGIGGGKVEIAGNVTYDNVSYKVWEIGKDAFANNALITSVTIPSSVEIINNFAFKGCSRLTQAVFADTQGWIRTAQGSAETIAANQLADAEQAAKLLKETRLSGTLAYQYVWQKKAAEK